MRRILTLLFSLAILLCPLQGTWAQVSIELKDVKAVYTFGEKIIFSATIISKSSIQSAYLLFQVEGDPNTHTIPLEVARDGKTTYTHLIHDGLIRPFSRLNYWYHLILGGNESFDSEHYSLQYDDNRYPWQTIRELQL